MKGDIINITDENLLLAIKIVKPLIGEIINSKQPYVISVAGESGAGKSSTAAALAETLKEKKLLVKIFQQDDYFYLPPFTNDKKRREDMEWVGLKEVNLKLLDKNLCQAKKGVIKIEKPLIIYKENKIIKEVFNMRGVQVCIVEGTYTSLLKNVDKRIFIDRDYKETFNDRKNRARDKMDSFIEQVLEIEHQIIHGQKFMADIILDKNFQVHFK